MSDFLYLANITLFLTNLFVFTYKILLKLLNRWFPPIQDPNFIAKKLLSPEPYEIPLYLGLTFIFVIVILFISKRKNRIIPTSNFFNLAIFVFLLVVFL